MALINNGVDVFLNTGHIPTGYTKPATTTFNDFQYHMSKTLTILKSSVSGADHAATLTNIVSSISSQMGTLIQNDFDVTGRTVTIYTRFEDIKTDMEDVNTMYNGTIANFICNCTVFIKCDSL